MAGQIPWEAIVEHEAKISLLNGDNEMESEFLGGDSIDMSKSSQKTVPMLSAPTTRREEELVQTTPSGSLLGYTATPADSQYASANGETMEICCVWLIQTNKRTNNMRFRFIRCAYQPTHSSCFHAVSFQIAFSFHLLSLVIHLE